MHKLGIAIFKQEFVYFWEQVRGTPPQILAAQRSLHLLDLEAKMRQAAETRQEQQH